MSASSAWNSPGTSSPLYSSGPPTPATEVEDLLDHVGQAENDADDEYILVTGGLGFIGSHTSLELLKAGYDIIIVDNLSNSYEDVYSRILLAAKLHHAKASTQCPKAELCCIDYRDTDAMSLLLEKHSISAPQHPPMLAATTQPVTQKSTITGVIHFAAYKQVAESIHHPLKYYRNNIQGLIDLLTLLDTHAIKTFIFSSSAAVYGSLSETRPQSSLTTTTTPPSTTGPASTPLLREEDCVHTPESYLDPETLTQKTTPQGCTGITNPYGRTKFFAEAILSDICASDPHWTVLALRYFNPIGCDSSGLLGEDPRSAASNLFPAAIRVLLGESKELFLYGSDWETSDGSAVRDFIHVSDLARGHTAALAAALGQTRPRIQKQTGFRTYNLGTGQGHSVWQVVRALEDVWEREIPVRVVGRREGDVGVCVARAERAREELGWRTERGLREACVDAWRYLGGREGGVELG
ncbi:UDP-GAL-4-epimerase [Aspergillus crustosus]